MTFLKHFNIALPIIQAPMAGNATTPALVAAVSNAGGLGSLAAGYMQPEEMRTAIKKIKALTNKPFAINLFVPEQYHVTDEQIENARQAVQASCSELNFKIDLIKPPYAPDFSEQMQVVLEENIPIFSFTFGIPFEWIEQLKNNQIVLLGTATHLKEAEQLEKAGIDYIIAQGKEAGGHRGTFIGNALDALTETNTLVSLFKQHIQTPIIAAGGIMNAHDIALALQAGAMAVQMGSAFLCCAESGIHPLYKELIQAIKHDTTALTNAFSGKFARGLQNKFTTRMKNETNVLPYPVQNALTTPMRKEANKQNNMDFVSMWAGQRAYLAKNISVQQLMQAIDDELRFNMKQV